MKKYCSRCKELLSLNAFRKKKNYKNGIESVCKGCVSARNKDYKQRHPEKLKAENSRVSQKRVSDPAFRERQRLRMKAWREKNPEHVRAKNIERYGLTIQEYYSLYEAQEGRCAICKREVDVSGPSKQSNKVQIDHCHKTGVVRGLLCMSCNTALGGVGDSVEILKRMIQYLGG